MWYASASSKESRVVRFARTVRRGFTLTEIMIAVALVGILMAVVIPYAMRERERGRVKATSMALQKISTAIEHYWDDMGDYPKDLKELVTPPPGTEGKWGPQYLSQKSLRDTWGRNYQYKLTPGADKEYDLKSYGPDGKKAKKSEWIQAKSL